MFEIDETGPWHRLPTELISDIVMMARPERHPVAEMVCIFYNDVYADILHLAARAANEVQLQLTNGWDLSIDEAWTQHHEVTKASHMAWVERLDTHHARVRIAGDYWFWYDLNETYGHLGIVGEFVNDDGTLDGDDVFSYFTGRTELIDPIRQEDFGSWDFPPTEVTAALVATAFAGL